MGSGWLPPPPPQHSPFLTLSICHLTLYLSFTIAFHLCGPSSRHRSPIILSAAVGWAEQVNILSPDEEMETQPPGAQGVTGLLWADKG